MSASDYLYPGASWKGTVTWTDRTPPADPTRTTFKPVARFGVVPYQDVTGDFTVPLLAYCKGGIASVQFWCEGNTVTVTAKSVVSEYAGRPFEAYTCVLQAANFPAFNGPFDVYATVTPTDGTAQARVVSLRLYRNKGDAIATVKYVGSSGTNDTSAGRGDTAGNPYLTISYAKDRINSAQSSDVGGGRIKVLAGTFSLGATTENADRLSANRWLTVEPADGVSREQVVIVSPGSLRTSKLRLRNLTLDQTTYWTVNTTGPLVDALWLDGCVCTGPGRTVDNTVPWHASAWTERYATDTSVTNYKDAFTLAVLARNCSIGTIGSDAFQVAQTIICCDIDTIDNSGGTGFHPDLWQITTGSTKENCLLYGLKAGPGVKAQGVFLDDGNILDMAVVNCLIENDPSAYYTQAGSGFTYSHVLWYENTWTGQPFLIDTGSDWEVRRNVFGTPSFTPNSAGIAASVAANTDYNHFPVGPTYGTHASSGTPDWSPTTHVPNGSGNLRPGVARLTLIDVDGNARSATNAALGALAANAEDGADETMTGGAATGGGAAVTSFERKAASGGAGAAGAATNVTAQRQIASGGSRAAGAGAVGEVINPSASGGASTAGAASSVVGWDGPVRGGSTAAGLAGTTSREHRDVSGGAGGAGDAEEGVTKAMFTVTGGLSVSGAAKLKDGPFGYDFHPVVKFQVNLKPIQNTELIGPDTNLRTTGIPVLVDLAPLTEISFPDVGDRLRHGDEFILQGEVAARTLRNHTNGVEGDYTSTPLVILKRY